MKGVYAMRIELTNTVGGYLLVTDEGITCKYVYSSSKERTLFFPFGSITSIKYSFGSLLIEGTRTGQTESIPFVCSSERFRKGQKEQLKSIVELAKNLMEKAEPDEVVEIFPESIKSSPEMKKEIRMKCCVCGHIFC